MSRYIKPPWYSQGGADDRHAMVEWQDGELRHETAHLDSEREPSPDDLPLCWVCRGDADDSKCNWICGVHKR